MTQLSRALDRLFGQLAGAHDFAKAPHRQREMDGCQDPRIQGKTESRQRVAIGRKVGERTFTVRQLRDLVVIDGVPPAK